MAVFKSVSFLCFFFFNNDGMIYYYIMPGFSMFAVIMVLSCAPSVLLLVRNVKNKTGVILSAVSLIINFVFLLWTLFCLFALNSRSI